MQKFALCFFFSILVIPAFTSHATQGQILGEDSYTIPDWFKDSFLEIEEDIRDANNNNRHVMLFMHIDRCPYCTRMLEENFQRGASQQFIEKNFDVIALNIRGDREIQWDDNTRFSEKALAAELKVHFTPTLIFLDSAGKKVYQMNGYRNPAAFKHVLNFVKDKKYLDSGLVEYVRQQDESIYTFAPHTLFKQVNDFSKINGPLAVIFEDRSCADCDEFHKYVLTHADVLQEMEKFTVVRLDAFSTEPIINVKGEKTTAQQWANELDLDYRPGTVLFDDGIEITRADGRLYHFHYKELLRYVSGDFYQQYPGYLKYLGFRQKQLLDAGVDIDFSL